MAPGEYLNLPDETEENTPNNEALVDTQPENEAPREELPFTPEVSEFVTEPEVEKAENEATHEELSSTPEGTKLVTEPGVEKPENEATHEELPSIPDVTELATEPGVEKAENEATHEELPSAPEVTELATEPEVEKAEDTPAIEIIDIQTDLDETKSNNIGSGAEVKVDNDEFTRDSTFMTELDDINEIQQENIDEHGKLEQLKQLCDESAILKEEMEESKYVAEEKLVDNIESIEQASFVEKIVITDDGNVDTVNIIDDKNNQPEDIPTFTQDSEDNIIVETMSEEVLALPVQQTEGPELRNTFGDDEPIAVPDIIPNKSSDNILAENAKDTENVSIIVLVLAAFVVYQIIQLKLCQLYSLVG